MRIGEALKRVRVNKKISRRKLGEDLGIDQETIKRIEIGIISNPRFLTLQKLFKYFGYQFVISITTDDFLEDDNESDSSV